MADETLDRRELLELSGSLLDIANGGIRLANVLVSHLPPTDSPAGLALADPLSTGSDGGIIRRSHEVMFFAALAGWDHAKALSTLLRGVIPATVSLASVARGGIEAFARVHWLLEPATTAEKVQRYLSLSISDLKFYIKLSPDSPLKTLGGDEVDATARRDALLGQLQALALPQLDAGPTARATGFLDAVFGGGAKKYSQLSGVAHAETLSVHSFVKIDDSPDAARSVALIQPRTVPIEWVGDLVVGGAKLGNWLAQEFHPPKAEWELWESCRSRAVDRFRAIDITRA